MSTALADKPVDNDGTSNGGPVDFIQNTCRAFPIRYAGKEKTVTGYPQKRQNPSSGFPHGANEKKGCMKRKRTVMNLYTAPNNTTT